MNSTTNCPGEFQLMEGGVIKEERKKNTKSMARRVVFQEKVVKMHSASKELRQKRPEEEPRVGL